MSDDTTPIGGGLSVPPPGKTEDHDYITRDIMSAIERAVMLLIERRAAAKGIGRRKAAAEVLSELSR